MTGYKWHPIEDLPDNWRAMANQELESLPLEWKNLSDQLRDTDTLPQFQEQFDERLNREWAIETGIIEGVYRIDRGTTKTLIEHGIKASLMPHGSTDRPPEWIVEVVKAQQDALEGIFAFVKQDRQLSSSYIKELHDALTRGQTTYDAKDPAGNWIKVPLEHGKWKTLPNNPTRPDGEMHEYCPPIHVDSEIEQVVKMHLKHTDVPPEVESAWLHHRFTQIHPFQDGNGRVARALASLISIRAGWFPLLIRRQDTAEYIGALEGADAGELSPLVSLFARRYIETFYKANKIAQRVLDRQIEIDGIIL